MSKITANWTESKNALPKDEVQCIVIRKIVSNGEEFNEMQALLFNPREECWDSADGDDVECELTDVTHWIEFPDFP